MPVTYIALDLNRVRGEVCYGGQSLISFQLRNSAVVSTITPWLWQGPRASLRG